MAYHLVAKITGKDKLEQAKAFQKLSFEEADLTKGGAPAEEDEDERGGVRSKIDHFIDLLQSQTEDSGEFIYLNPSTSNNPYDLQPIVDISAKDALKSNARDGLKNEKVLNIEKFYTLSKKGLTLYLNDEPHEFISLTDWLIERNYHHKISSMPFFMQFKRWKILRMWRRNIL